MEPTDNILDYMIEVHNTLPMINRTSFFGGVSLGLVLLGLVMIYLAYLIPSYRKNGIRKILSNFLKAVLCFTALVVIFLASFSSREISMICAACQTRYTFEETRFLGKRISIGNFQVDAKPECLISRPVGITKFRCSHSFCTEYCIRYWGGIIPATEYYIGEVLWLSHPDDPNESIILNRNMKLIKNLRDENGYPYTKVVVPEESGIAGENKSN
ncbi:MAG: hypothetical protein LBQ54_02500 [Planctomycetaceae bacterium]|jgi:hypothetical protein|nr:hypothetical protein [Planctomycetaceae bacterium]